MNIAAIGGGNREPAIEYLTRSLEDDPHVLIVPSACSTPAAYESKVAKCSAFFLDAFLLPSQVLHGFGEAPTKTQLEQEFGDADLIYTIGGNSPTMLRLMAEHGSDAALRQAILDDTPYAGVSAGALLPFSGMHSCVAKKPAEEDWDYKELHGLGILHAYATAHANQVDQTPQGPRPENRLGHLTRTLPEQYELGIGIDNGAALIIEDDGSFALNAVRDAQIHILVPTCDDPTHMTLSDGFFLPSSMHQTLMAG